MRTLLVFGAIGLGGAIGAAARALVAGRVAAWTSWPAWTGTMLVNVLGCAGIGFAWVWLEAHPEWLRALLVTGMLGAFTTFSTFGLDAMHLLEERRGGEVVAYVLGSIAIGFAVVKAAMVAAERLRG